MHRQVMDTKINNFSLRGGGLPQVTLLLLVAVCLRHSKHCYVVLHTFDKSVVLHLRMFLQLHEQTTYGICQK